MLEPVVRSRFMLPPPPPAVPGNTAEDRWRAAVEHARRGPRYMEPKLTPEERSHRPINGLAKRMILGVPVVEHDAAADPPLSARIDLLA